MNYTLNQLQIFLKVVETESVTKASQELHLTQPAVSIQLKNLQDQFDFPLTEVIGRKIYITDFGRDIAHSAEQILQEVTAINYKSKAYLGSLSGKLKISIVSTGKYIMPYFLSDFMKENNQVDLQMDVTNKQKVIESLENNAVDFALVSILPRNLAVEYIDLLRNKLFLVGKEKVSANKVLNTRDMIQDLPLIFREKGSGTRQTMEEFIERKNFTVHKKIELTSNEAVKQAILAGLGYSIMPLIGIRNELIHGELKIIPAKGLPIQTNWRLIWLKGKKLSPLAHAFLNYIKNEKSRLVKSKFKWYEEY